MITRCPTCNRLMYERKGFNKKSLLNLNHGYSGSKEKKIIIITKNKRCIMKGCKNKKFAKSNLCLEHIVKRDINNLGDNKE